MCKQNQDNMPIQLKFNHFQPYMNLLIDNDSIEVDQTVRTVYKKYPKSYEFIVMLKRRNDELLKLVSHMRLWFFSLPTSD